MVRAQGAPRPGSYRLLKTLAWVVAKVFLRRINVTGASRITEGRPAVIAANHTNGLGDPIVLAAKLPGLPRFLAASYLWKLPPARLLFHLAEVIPIYRRRDGADTSANASMFSACHEALAQGSHLALFPEGEVHREPAMLPLKTEWFRHPGGALSAARASRDDVLAQVGALVGEPMVARAQVSV